MARDHSPLRRARDLSGLSQEEVAAALGVEQVTVSRWERGTRKVNVDVLGRLVELYKTSPGVLMGIEPFPEAGP